jgi:hypothetical protein
MVLGQEKCKMTMSWQVETRSTSPWACQCELLSNAILQFVNSFWLLMWVNMRAGCYTYFAMFGGNSTRNKILVRLVGREDFGVVKIWI